MANKMSSSDHSQDLKFFQSPMFTYKKPNTSPELRTKKSLLLSNQVMSNLVEKNKKYIKTLQGVLAWILSSSHIVAPEVTNLLLCSMPAEIYDFELCLVSEFNKYICKSKYINFTVELRPLRMKTIPSNERISIETSLFSSDVEPKQILSTMQGKPIIRGRSTEYMIYHPSENRFLVRIKMQITEVSSHFINGNLSLVVAKKPEVQHSIKPLVIKDIIVKAKEKTCKRWREQTTY